MDGEASSPNVETSLTALRYWVPTIADCARIVETPDGTGWRFAVRPHIPGGCGFVVNSYGDGRLEVQLNGGTSDALTVSSFGDLIAMAEAIVEGHVVRRTWHSSVTGASVATEFVVEGRNGRTWRQGRDLGGFDGRESRDQAYLPYRRPHD